jgi:hypothetical protein
VSESRAHSFCDACFRRAQGFVCHRCLHDRRGARPSGREWRRCGVLLRTPLLLRPVKPFEMPPISADPFSVFRICEWGEIHQNAGAGALHTESEMISLLSEVTKNSTFSTDGCLATSTWFRPISRPVVKSCELFDNLDWAFHPSLARAPRQTTVVLGRLFGGYFDSPHDDVSGACLRSKVWREATLRMFSTGFLRISRLLIERVPRIQTPFGHLFAPPWLVLNL